MCRAAEGCRARPKALRGLRGQAGAHWAPLVCPLTQDHWSAPVQGRESPYRVCSSFGVLSPGLWGPQHCRMGVLSSPPSPAPTPGDIAWAGLSPTELQSELNIKNPNQTQNQALVGSAGFLCIKDENMNICAVNAAFIHSGSPPDPSQHLHRVTAGEGKPRETQGLDGTETG